MTYRCIVFALLMPLCGSTASADPVRIVDTGPGPAATFGVTVWPDQWLAAGFTTTQPYNIQSIEAWMDVQRSGLLTVRLYRGELIPETSLFSRDIFLAREVPEVADWKGVYGLGWTIEPGTYWVAFEASAASAFIGGLPFPSGGGPRFAQRDTSRPSYEPRPGSWGVRVDAEPLSPVPEPMTAALVGGGLTLVAWRRRVVQNAPRHRREVVPSISR